MDWNIIWQAVSGVGTLLAVITALSIVKYENHLNNKKKIKIRWRLGYLHLTRKPLDKYGEDNLFDHLALFITNTGNRVIFITSITFENENGTFFTYVKKDELNTPRKLDVEECLTLHIPADEFCKECYSRIDRGLCNANESITIVVTDTVGEEYRHKIENNISFYTEHYLSLKNK